MAVSEEVSAPEGMTPICMTFQRTNTTLTFSRVFGSATTDTGWRCALCEKPVLAGQYTVLIQLGPGDDPEARKRAREGRWYNTYAIGVHYACATGRDAPEKER